MASITSLGVGSGLDLNSMVTQLVALESRPLSLMQTEARALQTQVSSYGQLTSLFGALQTAANKLTNPSLWSQSLASSADENRVRVSAGANAATGTYSVTTSRLASGQTVVAGSALAGSSELVGSGVMTLELGSWDQPPMNFVPQVGRDPVTVTVTAEDTLATLRDKINAAGAGVTASVVTDASGSRLALTSTTTGETNGFRVSVSDDDGAALDDGLGLSRFAFDPAAGGNGMSMRTQAQNALATVNGIEVSSASNTLSGVVEGLTLTLRATGGPTDITVSQDKDAVKTAIQEFAKAYSDLTRVISDQTKYDAGSKVSGPLQGDSAATGLQRQLRSLLGAGSEASAAFPRMADVGLILQRDGTINVDSKKLDAALGNLDELKKAFSANDVDPAKDGFARRYADLAMQVTGIDGALTTRTEGLRKRITQNGEAQTALSDRVERFRARLVAQYTTMDANLARLNALSGYVTQQLTALSQLGNQNKS